MTTEIHAKSAETSPACWLLIVEDDHDIREALIEVLSEAGFAPVAVSNGREALALLRERPARPCAIILDLMMPVMDGREFRDLQSRDPELRDIPTVLLTAHANRDSAVAGMGAITYVRKPVDLDVLLDTVTGLCGPPRAPQS